LGHAPDFHAIPVATRATSRLTGKVTTSTRKPGKIESLPKMLGFQAEGAAPLVLGHGVDKPETVATAIRIGHPARGEEALQARDESGGLIDCVSDAEILKAPKADGFAIRHLWRTGLRRTIGGIARCRSKGYFKEAREALGRKPVVVSVSTGHGPQDPNTHQIGGDRTVVPAESMSVLRAMGASEPIFY
jgi:threonine synthase